MSSTLLWLRQDLRLEDNPALQAAVARGGPIVPVYILDEAGEWGRAPGAASRWWLHQSLTAFDASLRARGSRLVLASGDSETIRRRGSVLESPLRTVGDRARRLDRNGIAEGRARRPHVQRRAATRAARNYE
jgi:hypothetical protein